MAKALTRAAIMSSLKKLMSEKDFNRITVDEICEDATISRRNFYRYFKDKYDVLSHIYTEEFVSKIEYHDDWTVWDYFPRVIQFFYDNRDFCRNAAMVEGQNSARNYWREFLRPLMMKDLRDSFLSDKAADFYIYAITEALFDRVALWLNSPEVQLPEDFAEEVRVSVAMHARVACDIAGREPAKGSVPDSWSGKYLISMSELGTEEK